MSADKGRMLRLDPSHPWLMCCKEHYKGGNGNRCTIEAQAMRFEETADDPEFW